MQVMPFVEKETCFALKGGTAINFFLRDMPRLSVDIDFIVPLNGYCRLVQYLFKLTPEVIG